MRKMLASLGQRWCRLYIVDEHLLHEPLASAHQQSQSWARISLVARRLGDHLHIDQVKLLGRGETALVREPGRHSKSWESVTPRAFG